MTVFAAFKRKLFGHETSSKSLARSRLHFVLVQDRTGLTAEEMAAFKKEMIDVIGKYFMIDKNGFDISYQRDADTTTLLINSPVIVRRQEGDHANVGTVRERRKQRLNKEVTPEPHPAA